MSRSFKKKDMKSQISHDFLTRFAYKKSYAKISHKNTKKEKKNLKRIQSTKSQVFSNIEKITENEDSNILSSGGNELRDINKLFVTSFQSSNKHKSRSSTFFMIF